MNFSLYVMTMFFMAIERERAFMGYAFSFALLNVVFNALLIPRYDFVGAELGEPYHRGRYAVRVHRRVVAMRGSPPYESMSWTCLTALLSGVILLWLPAPLIVRAVCCGVLYCAGIIWGGGISADGRCALYSLLPIRLRFTVGVRG